MERFSNGTEAAWDNLSDRARQACVVFADCHLPPGCVPPRARVGFEIHPAEAILLVDKNIRYDGRSDAVRTWLEAGEKRFSGMAGLRAWISAEIAPLFGSDPGLEAGRPAGPARPGDLTDLAEVASTAALHAAVSLGGDDLLSELRSKVFGQDTALEVLARRVTQHVRRTSPRRPSTVFALGPTGVGKTQTGKALAESLGTLLGGRWSALVRLNMNEYQERHRVSQLLGAPPSYIGYGDGTPLIDSLAVHPESIVLFDEIEKAHPDILVALMSAMDTGELSSPAPAAGGRPVDCRRAVFFFTSNVDASSIISQLDASSSDPGPADRLCRRQLAASGIRPELVGRIGTFLVFHPLTAFARAEIATAGVVRVAAEYGLTVIRIDPEVISSIVNRPYDDLGARPDEYHIDDLLSAEFSRYASSGQPPAVMIKAGPGPLCVPAAGLAG